MFQKVDVCVKKHWTRYCYTGGIIHAVQFILSPCKFCVSIVKCNNSQRWQGFSHPQFWSTFQEECEKEARLKCPCVPGKPQHARTFCCIIFVPAPKNLSSFRTWQKSVTLENCFLLRAVSWTIFTCWLQRPKIAYTDWTWLRIIPIWTMLVCFDCYQGCSSSSVPPGICNAQQTKWSWRIFIIIILNDKRSVSVYSVKAFKRALNMTLGENIKLMYLTLS